MNIGLIGCGGIGALRAAAIAKSASLQLSAVADVDPARAHALAGQFGSVAASDWKSLVAQQEIDAVVVSTPPNSHAEIVVAALQAGKHVLCEKPLGRTPAECQAMVDAAAAAHRVLSTGFNYRFYPSVLMARTLLDSGMIGELDHIRSYAGYSATDHNPPWVHDADMMGGGALRDNGIHLLDLTRYFLGEVADVQGEASGWTWQFDGCEDNGFALLRGENGRIATVQASWTEWAGYRFMLEIYGTRGFIRTSCFPMKTEVAWAERTGGPVKRRTYRFLGDMLQEHLRSYRWLVIQSFIKEFSAFSDVVGGKANGTLASGLDGLRTVEIAHTVAHAGAGRDSEALVHA
ncbi:MAG TPA: Gfo/Idh/MocA family oxidoreductase [Longimicrobiales bacterium]